MIFPMTSSARKHRDSGNTVTAETQWQCKPESSTLQDGRRQRDPDSEMQVEQNSLSFSRVSGDPQGPHSLASSIGTRRHQRTFVGMITHCECNNGFVLKSTAKDDESYHTCENVPICLGGRCAFQGLASTRSMVTPVRDLLVMKKGRTQTACVIATGRVAAYQLTSTVLITCL